MKLRKKPKIQEPVNLVTALVPSDTSCLANFLGRTKLEHLEVVDLVRELLKDIIVEGAHDAHGFARDLNVTMHILEHLEDVDLVGHASLFDLLCLLSRGRILGHVGNIYDNS